MSELTVDTDTKPHEFQPSWVSSPGETISEVLRLRQFSLEQFSDAIAQTPEDASALLEGRLAITIALARRLTTVLGASVEFWMSRDYLYRQGARRLQAEHREWLDALPMGDMIRFGWIKPAPRATEEAVAALRFFDVPSVETWHETYAPIERLTAFRASPSFESQPGAVAAWLREGERRAAAQVCDPWNAERFRAVLMEVRTLTRIGDPQRFLPRLQESCASAGVAVVPLRAPTGCRASGATRFLSPQKALLLLSFRHRTDDHFWFTFFHEAAHLLLHDPSQVFVEGLEQDGGDAMTVGGMDDLFMINEREADEFAAGTLIPADAQATLRAVRPDAKAILRLASKLGIAPGILVGQLQHIGRLRPQQLNSLKQRYAWAEDGATSVRQPRQPRNRR